MGAVRHSSAPITKYRIGSTGAALPTRTSSKKSSWVSVNSRPASGPKSSSPAVVLWGPGSEFSHGPMIIRDRVRAASVAPAVVTARKPS